MDNTVRVTLPGGRWADGERCREGRLRPLSGRDEVALLEDLGGAPWPILTTKILARCLLELGPTPIDEDTVRGLSAGDREALLWHLRRSASDRLDAIVTCVRCGEKASIEMSVADLLQPPYAKWQPRYVEDLAGRSVEFRLPTGKDLEDVTIAARIDVEGSADQILKACVLAVDGQVPTSSDLEELRGPVTDRMAALDPQAEALLETTCPACGNAMTAVLDAGAFLFEEMAQRSRFLYREVHVLAATYHWSETDILAMTAERRRIYLDIIEEGRAGEEALR